PEEPEANAIAKAPAASFAAALRTIVVADAVMGVDNVLAIGGAASGSLLLIVLGLAISVPIVVWGSHLVIRLVDRLPSIILLGGARAAARRMAGNPRAAWVRDRGAGVLVVAGAVVRGTAFRAAEAAGRPAAGLARLAARLRGSGECPLSAGRLSARRLRRRIP